MRVTVGRTFGNPDGDERQPYGHGVGHHVGSVGEETQTSGKQATEYLDGNVANYQRQNNQQGAFAGASVFVRVIVGAAGSAILSVRVYPRVHVGITANIMYWQRSIWLT